MHPELSVSLLKEKCSQLMYVDKLPEDELSSQVVYVDSTSRQLDDLQTLTKELSDRVKVLEHSIQRIAQQIGVYV